jgi:ectoine hydroxylase-related dioxygenase (phytanoyl-CoA dioxygenase family)
MALSTIDVSRGGASRLPLRILRRVQGAMARDGAVRLESLFPLGVLKRARREVLRRHDSGELRERGLVRDIAGRYAAVLPFEGPFLDPRFYANPKLLDIVAALLGTTHCIGSLEAVIAMPGAYEQHLHVDGPLRLDRVLGKTKKGYAGDLSGLPPYAVTLCVPLCDIDEDNGPTALWPGSHRTALRARIPGEREILRGYPAEPMTGALGQAFLFDFRIFHCGLPNLSREARPILMFVFTRSWFRDPNLTEVFPSVVISPRDLKRVPQRHRRLFMLAQAARRPLWQS